MSLMKKIGLALALAMWMGGALAEGVDDLVRQIQEAQARELRADQDRKARFLADKSQQQKLLAETRAALAKAEADSKALREQFTANEARIKALNAELKTKTGEISSLFGAVRDFSGKLKSDLAGSLVSAQYPGRADALEGLAHAKELPNIPQLEKLWLSVLQEMAETGKVAQYQGKVDDAAGVERTAGIVRVGPFTAFSGDKYLRYVPESGKLAELRQQPGEEYLAWARNLRGAGGLVKVAVDPGRGAVLDKLQAQAAPALEWPPRDMRSLLSAAVDYGIIGVLLLGSIWALAVAFERWLFYRGVDVRRFPNRAALETELTRHLTVIGTVAANAPYIGLLGTVLGIMLTFNKMGTDKSLMDVHNIMVGLSLALKATAMGLLVAIPCAILNNMLRRRIRVLVTEYEVRHGS